MSSAIINRLSTKSGQQRTDLENDTENERKKRQLILRMSFTSLTSGAGRRRNAKVLAHRRVSEVRAGDFLTGGNEGKGEGPAWSGEAR